MTDPTAPTTTSEHPPPTPPLRLLLPWVLIVPPHRFGIPRIGAGNQSDLSGTESYGSIDGFDD